MRQLHMVHGHFTRRKINLLSITDNAKTYLTKAIADQHATYVRLGVYGGGCSGFTYKWDFVDTTDNGTLIDDMLVLDQMSEMYVIGCTVDWVNELGGSYLKIVNPNAVASCGCGESFAV